MSYVSHTLSSASLQSELEQQHRVELESIRSDREREREDWGREHRQMQSQREKEVSIHQPTHQPETIPPWPQVSQYRRQLEEAEREARRASEELSVTRTSLHGLKEESSLFRKQLELRSQELVSAKREAANILRCVCERERGRKLWCVCFLRCREQELSSAHHGEVEALASQYSQQSQLLLNNFNRVKRTMRAEIAQLQRQ